MLNLYFGFGECVFISHLDVCFVLQEARPLHREGTRVPRADPHPGVPLRAACGPRPRATSATTRTTSTTTAQEGTLHGQSRYLWTLTCDGRKKTVGSVTVFKLRKMCTFFPPADNVFSTSMREMAEIELSQISCTESVFTLV